MARALPVEYPGAFYHITNRGNAGDDIFKSLRDRDKLFEYLQSSVEHNGLKIHTYCLMTNHFNKKILSIPGTEDQVRDLLGKISSSNQNEATRGIVSLALAGNLEAFTKLLNAQNPNDLSLYCSYYQNANEKKCIDPVLEAAVIEYLDDPELGEAFLRWV